MRRYSTSRTIMAGCFVCNGSDAIWHGPNAQAVAARHHDATGHATWADVAMTVYYGEADSSEGYRGQKADERREVK